MAAAVLAITNTQQSDVLMPEGQNTRKIRVKNPNPAEGAGGDDALKLKLFLTLTFDGAGTVR